MNRFSNSKQMNKQIKTLKSRNVSLSKDLMEANASREELAEANRKLEKENRMYSKPHSHRHAQHIHTPVLTCHHGVWLCSFRTEHDNDEARAGDNEADMKALQRKVADADARIEELARQLHGARSEAEVRPKQSGRHSPRSQSRTPHRLYDAKRADFKRLADVELIAPDAASRDCLVRLRA